MEGILRVTPQTLQNTSNEFSNNGTEIANLTQQMTDIVNGLSSFWTGEASEAFRAKFAGLADDIQRIINMVKEHSVDLNDMAQVYIDADIMNSDLISNLSSDVIV